eukprot:Seg1049.3 transcript_id=Seg1049.3/GoldUCD/mRNA.D3Y31 product="hypothetical protein" protein_id=Seg1049.3/GoldUCD/D3Y31
MLPTEYHSSRKPKSDFACDYPGCISKRSKSSWVILGGCSHSFHRNCIPKAKTSPICKQYLKVEMETLKSTIKQGVISKNDSIDNSKQYEETNDTEIVNIAAVATENISPEIDAMNNRIKSLKPTSEEKNEENFLKIKKAKHC